MKIMKHVAHSVQQQDSAAHFSAALQTSSRENQERAAAADAARWTARAAAEQRVAVNNRERAQAADAARWTARAAAEQQAAANNRERAQAADAARWTARAAAEQQAAANNQEDAQAGDGEITVVDLNSAGGLGHDLRNGWWWWQRANGSSGLDLNDRDLRQSVDDLFADDQDPDIVTMQELPIVASTGTPEGTPDIGELQGIKQRLEERTGDEWVMYVNAGTHLWQYYRAEPGRMDGEGIMSNTGTAIFVRRGSGSDIESSSAILPSHDDENNGVSYQNTNAHNGGSLLGVRMVTRDGEEFDVYTAHTDPEDKNNEIKDVVSEVIHKSEGRRVIFTGDFNTDLDESSTLRNLVDKEGFVDECDGDGDTAPNRVLDHIFTRGFDIPDDQSYVFHAPSSDHEGLVIIIDPTTFANAS